ncbi:polysaccharide deacetylase family protein [Bacillaceae bacterium S4-13-56]
MGKKYVHFLVFILFAYLSWNAYDNPYTESYIDALETVPVTSNQQEQELMNKIKEIGAQYEEEPKDAVIDKVWKKIPGYNGLKLDVEESYNQMKEKGKFDKNLLSFREVEPEISLNELPPAPIYRGNPNKNMVSLMINVSWGREHIPAMLQALKDQKVKATFFIEGKWAQEHEEDVKLILEEGHEIGNHAYNHPDLRTKSISEIRQQLEQTNEILESITGEVPTLFAPPSGAFTQDVVEVASSLGMETILWTADTIDWKKPTEHVMIKRVMDKIDNGTLILMHPTPVMANGLEELILKIKEKEYRIGTVTNTLSEKR